MKNLRRTYAIHAPVEKVWDALVQSKIIERWMGSKPKMDDKVGTKFSLWDGSIIGENLKVVKNKQLVQDWQEKGWKEPSKVTFNLKEEDGATEIELIHEGIPDSSLSDIAEGWKKYYLGEIKNLLEE